MDNLEKIVNFARAYSKLGQAVQEQLGDLIADDFVEINPNAVKVIKLHLGGKNEIFDEIIANYELYQKELS